MTPRSEKVLAPITCQMHITRAFINENLAIAPQEFICHRSRRQRARFTLGPEMAPGSLAVNP